MIKQKLNGDEITETLMKKNYRSINIQDENVFRKDMINGNGKVMIIHLIFGLSLMVQCNI